MRYPLAVLFVIILAFSALAADKRPAPVQDCQILLIDRGVGLLRLQSSADVGTLSGQECLIGRRKIG
jgi:hypothetical protein